MLKLTPTWCGPLTTPGVLNLTPEFLQCSRAYMGSSISIVPFIFQRLCDDLYQCLILVFSVIYLDSRGNGDISGAPVRVFEKFRSLFSFLPFLFFFFLFYSSLFSLSLGAPLAPGPWALSTHATQSLRHCFTPL